MDFSLQLFDHKIFSEAQYHNFIKMSIGIKVSFWQWQLVLGVLRSGLTGWVNVNCKGIQNGNVSSADFILFCLAVAKFIQLWVIYSGAFSTSVCYQSGEIAPERMKRMSQSENNAQLWMCLVMKWKSSAVKNKIIYIGTWNVRSMNQGKLQVVKQEMARVNIDILEISERKWTRMGEFNVDDHYIY